MDAFAIRDGIIDAYSDYVKGFITIKDENIKETVYHELDNGRLWPDPMVQINPLFEPGPTVDELVARNELHPKCAEIFRFDKAGKNVGLHMHHHQYEALKRAQAGHNYIVTTGTGSGKSLTYIVPIVDYVLKNPSPGIKAIIVYPMNALANSQEGELNKFISEGFDEPQIRIARYTGQEREERRLEIQENPPDILITNYMMLELLLTRSKEAGLISAARGLPFIVFDELHTYRGRQGADVSLLIRRLRNQLEAPNALCIGTSATLADEQSSDPRGEVAKVASRIFGSEFSSDDVIEETLRSATAAPPTEASLKQRLESGFSGAFSEDPLSAWIEHEIGLTEERGRLIRAVPKPVTGPDGAGAKLAAATGLDIKDCEAAIKQHLLHSYALARDGDETARAFAFRLHQFISRGGVPYVNLGLPGGRETSLNGSYWNPKDSSQPLFPLVFCRECGQEYLVGWHSKAGLSPRNFYDSISEDEDAVEPVYLYVGDEEWDSDNLPADWYKDDGKLVGDRKKWIPTTDSYDLSGKPNPDGNLVTIIRKPFRFCLHCMVSHNFRTRGDFSKLVSLDAEARSTATTILAQGALLGLRNSDLPDVAKKLLSFTDNRQDASLQAGHFNDFTQVSVIRSALANALQTHRTIRTADIPEQVLNALGLDVDAFASQKDLPFAVAQEVKSVMHEVLAYRVVRDLERGWRVTSPNLEQTGLLRLDFPGITEHCGDSNKWDNVHDTLRTASAEQKEALLAGLAHHMTRSLCIQHPSLDKLKLEKLQGRSQDNLVAQWAIDADESLSLQRFLVPRASQKEKGAEYLFVGPTSNFGLFVKRTLSTDLKKDDIQHIIEDLAISLERAGLAVPHKHVLRGETVYQIVLDRIQWAAGDGTVGAVDELRTPGLKTANTNKFFVDHYLHRGQTAAGLTSREHTAQVRSEVREEREELFRTAELPLLFCSPTMELGVDIAQLNVVNMRNVPPTPANYAQRSGRAGRSGQPAVVFTYCSRSSPHDQFFFDRPELMVRGAVRPPAIDLGNEDLVRSHVHAVWLKEAEMDLGSSLAELVDTNEADAYLEMFDRHVERLRNQDIKAKAKESAYRLVDAIPNLDRVHWCGPNSVHGSPHAWVDHVIENIESSFRQSLKRWENLVRTAVEQARRQTHRIETAGNDTKVRKQAQRLQREANAQQAVLMNDDKESFGDFYSYRYFASEGFLPGYNFPRLPISAFMPGKRGGRGDYLNRARFIAISEFGPRSILYSEGSKYRIIAAKQPPGDTDDAGLNLAKGKLCNECGAYMQIQEVSPDTCGACNSNNLYEISTMFRLENVVTKRVQHISSDEEERRRLGFDVRTGITPSRNAQRGKILISDQEWGNFDYIPSAELWRINLGEKRRKSTTADGFDIDLETGQWATSQQDDEDTDSVLSKPARVVPYVTDHANSLVLRCPEALGDVALATLQSALKAAIQAEYSMEDRELSVESLPDRDNRKAILFYESSAGGAGVLRRIADEPKALAEVATRALELLHFEPDGTDLGVNRRGDTCSKACYDCLMSYMNQRDHRILDRHSVVAPLLDLKECKVEMGASGKTRAELLAELSRDAQKWRSEKVWLQTVENHGFHLPTSSQVKDERVGTKPDFAYENVKPPVYIYVDGSIHHETDIKRRDENVNKELRKHGQRAIRFPVEEGRQPEDMIPHWTELMQKHRDVFGEPQ